MSQIPTNTALLREILTGFIRNEVQKTGLTRVIVGLSGGVDSALSAMLGRTAAYDGHPKTWDSLLKMDMHWDPGIDLNQFA